MSPWEQKEPVWPDAAEIESFDSALTKPIVDKDITSTRIGTAVSFRFKKYHAIFLILKD